MKEALGRENGPPIWRLTRVTAHEKRRRSVDTEPAAPINADGDDECLRAGASSSTLCGKRRAVIAVNNARALLPIAPRGRQRTPQASDVPSRQRRARLNEAKAHGMALLLGGAEKIRRGRWSKATEAMCQGHPST
jgi:hypothetical protein